MTIWSNVVMMQRWLIATCLVTVFVSSVAAQPPGRGRFGAFGRSRLLIELDPIREELDVTETQADLLDALQFDLSQQREAILRGDERPRLSDDEVERRRREDLAERIAKFDRESEALVAVVLKPDQASRLKELYVQRDGPRALDREDVAMKLQLTEDQKKDLVKLRASFAEKLQETFISRRNQFRNRSGFREAMREADRLRDEELEEARKLLSEEQRTLWSELLGEPFDFAIMSGRRDSQQ